MRIIPGFTMTYRESILLKSLVSFVTPSGVLSASVRTQFASDLASDLVSEAPFCSKQIRRTRDPRLLWSQSMVPNLCLLKRNHSLLITSNESQFAIQLFHYRLPLFPVQLHAVSWVKIFAKSNKFLFSMILVWDWKWVNIARYSMEDPLNSGRLTVGRPREHLRPIGQSFITPFLGGRRSVSSLWSEAVWMLNRVEKRLYSPSTGSMVILPPSKSSDRKGWFLSLVIQP